jgi:hypothetical protein
MFNALSGLGAGGSMSSNVSLTDSANGALYGCFAIVGFFAGTFTNTIGVKYTLTVSLEYLKFKMCDTQLVFPALFFLFSYRLVLLATLYIPLPCGFMIVNKSADLLLLQVPF